MDARSRQREDAEEAYQIQANAAVEGGARAGAIGLGSVVLGHYAWPLLRRQTLAFKAFLVMGCKLSGNLIEQLTMHLPLIRHAGWYDIWS
ncbi:hypothetical protein AX14_006016 [Amanita brunnescens Koide BX004]|nr:hypothetical protein AX14_006016 [Amanita brunnescens Koide BX004]